MMRNVASLSALCLLLTAAAGGGVYYYRHRDADAETALTPPTPAAENPAVGPIPLAESTPPPFDDAPQSARLVPLSLPGGDSRLGAHPAAFGEEVVPPLDRLDESGASEEQPVAGGRLGDRNARPAAVGEVDPFGLRPPTGDAEATGAPPADESQSPPAALVAHDARPLEDSAEETTSDEEEIPARRPNGSLASSGDEKTPADEPSSQDEPSSPEDSADQSSVPNEEPPATRRQEPDRPLRRQPLSREPLPRPEGAAGTVEGVGRPGPKELDGPQGAQLTLEKIIPPDLQVGKPATVKIKVRNMGTAAAGDVRVVDQIPQGTRLQRTSPEATNNDGTLEWTLGALKANSEIIVEMEIVPLVEGEIGSVASVLFRAEAAGRAMVTRPELTLAVRGPDQALIGESLNFKVTLSNTGSGVARDVVLGATIPEELKHAAGSELELDVGDLKPGEKRELDLALTAAKAGQAANRFAARGDGNLNAEQQLEVNVVAPGLKVAMNGPKRRYLERNATYVISVENPGTASARDVELVTVLPKGLKFVEANNAGTYDAATHSVYWSLEELPPQETGTVNLITRPVEQGEHTLKIQGRAQLGLADDLEETITIEGIAALRFELVDVHDPVEIGGEATYEIRVTNQGSRGASNVQLAALLPEELKFVSAQGPSRHSVEGDRVQFAPLRQLAPKADATYVIKTEPTAAGDLRVRVQLQSDEIRTPITREESTRVFGDE